jgi:hypothetical protein
MYYHDMFLTEVDAEHGRIKAGTEVKVIHGDEDFCVIMDETGTRDLIDHVYLIEC